MIIEVMCVKNNDILRKLSMPAMRAKPLAILQEKQFNNKSGHTIKKQENTANYKGLYKR